MSRGCLVSWILGGGLILLQGYVAPWCVHNKVERKNVNPFLEVFFVPSRREMGITEEKSKVLEKYILCSKTLKWHTGHQASRSDSRFTFAPCHPWPWALQKDLWSPKRAISSDSFRVMVKFIGGSLYFIYQGAGWFPWAGQFSREHKISEAKIKTNSL